MSDFNEVKSLIEAQGQAWAEFKTSNDALIKAKADGKAVADLEAKVATLTGAMDKFSEVKEAIEQLQIKAARPDLGTDKASAALAEEVKGFNLTLRADYQSKGRQIPSDLDAKTYAQYKSGFLRVMAGTPLDQLSADERKAMSAGSDPDGGYLLPNSTQGAMVKVLFEQSIMRQIANVQTISTGKIEGVVDDDEADAGWVAELGTRSDSGTPQLRRWEIEAHEMYAMPKMSQKLIDDSATDVESWLAAAVADKFGRVEGTAFWQGTGVGQPRGVTTYTTAATADGSRTWGQLEHVVSGASGGWHTTKLDPIQDLQGAMKDHFLTNAIWVMRREARTGLRKLKEATSDRYLWEPSNQVGQPDRLNGYPVRVDQYLPALASASLSVAFGDFRAGYTIADRIGVRTLRDPFTAKPYVVFYSTKRTGGGVVNFEAIKLIKFSS